MEASFLTQDSKITKFVLGVFGLLVMKFSLP